MTYNYADSQWIAGGITKQNLLEAMSAIPERVRGIQTNSVLVDEATYSDIQQFWQTYDVDGLADSLYAPKQSKYRSIDEPWEHETELLS